VAELAALDELVVAAPASDVVRANHAASVNPAKGRVLRLIWFTPKDLALGWRVTGTLRDWVHRSQPASPRDPRPHASKRGPLARAKVRLRGAARTNRPSGFFRDRPIAAAR